MRNILQKNFHKLYLNCFKPVTKNFSYCGSLRVCQGSSPSVKGLSSSCKYINCYTNGFRFAHTSQEQISSSNKEKNDVIYYGALTGQVKGIKVVTCLSSVGGIVLQPIIIQNILSGSNTPVGIALCSCVAFFTFVTPFLIHLLTKKYVTEIQYNKSNETYTATTLSFFLRKINTTFKLEDIKTPDSLPMFTTMIIKDRPVFIVSDNFLEVDHYIKMKGYDKPMDLKLATGSVETDKNKEN